MGDIDPYMSILKPRRHNKVRWLMLIPRVPQRCLFICLVLWLIYIIKPVTINIWWAMWHIVHDKTTPVRQVHLLCMINHLFHYSCARTYIGASCLENYNFARKKKSSLRVLRQFTYFYIYFRLLAYFNSWCPCYNEINVEHVEILTTWVQSVIQRPNRGRKNTQK